MADYFDQFFSAPDLSNGIGGIYSSPSTNPAMFLDPIGSSILGDLFGFGGEDKPKLPLQIRDGLVYNPNVPGRNPIPVSDIPFVNKWPNKGSVYPRLADQIRAFSDLMPYYARAIAGQIIPQEQAKLRAAQATSPGFSQLMLDLYKQFGPQLNEVGNQISLQNAIAQAERDKTIVSGPGRDLVKEALETAKLYDPEFFKTRELTSNRLADLMNSIDLGQGLSPTERDEISKGLVREGVTRGTVNAPSNLDTIANASVYGQAGRAKEMQNKDALSRAIAASTAFLPASRSGVDVFQVATGKPSIPNPGENRFTGIQHPGNEALQLAQGTSGLINNAMTEELQRQQIKSQEKDWLDQFVQFTQGLSNVGSFAGSIGGGIACWIAREVFGEYNPKWLAFRHWLFTKASEEFRQLYIDYGQRFAQYIKDKHELKNNIRIWMNERISEYV